MIRSLLIAAALGLGSAASMPAAADAPPLVGGETLAPAPDDGELSRFVSAFLRLVGVQHGYLLMMRTEDDPVRLAEMKRHALEDMSAAVRQDGMTVERYNAIATALGHDSGLQGRVEAILQQMAVRPGEE